MNDKKLNEKKIANKISFAKQELSERIELTSETGIVTPADFEVLALCVLDLFAIYELDPK